jgi:hypothetical protein
MTTSDLTPDQLRIADPEAKVAAANKRRIAHLEHALAVIAELARQPVVVHFVEDVFLTVDGKPRTDYRFGYEITVTVDTYRDSINDDLGPWFDLLDHEDLQARRWGKVCFRRGPWPPDLLRLRYGSSAWAQARELDRQLAWSIENAEDRVKALAEVNSKYGPSLPTSQTLNAAPLRPPMTRAQRNAAPAGERVETKQSSTFYPAPQPQADELDHANPTLSRQTRTVSTPQGDVTYNAQDRALGAPRRRAAYPQPPSD